MHAFQQRGFGFPSLNPIKAVKSAAHAAVHPISTAKKGARVVVHDTALVARRVGTPLATLALLPVVELNKVVLGPVARVALRPVRAKVDTLKDRRARKLAWDRRRSTTPSTAERAEAKGWAQSYLRHQVPPIGLMLSLLAGPPSLGLFGSSSLPVSLGEPATATVIASIPAMIALLNTILSRTSRSGEAPAHINADAAGRAVSDLTAKMTMPGASDVTAAQDAGSDAGGDGSSSGGDSKSVSLPGGHNVKKSYLLIGGAVAGGLVLVLLLTRKKR